MEMMSVPTLPDSAVMVDVYEPAEDTYLFLDGLLAEREFFNTELRPTLALEIGSGSGAVLTAFAQQLEAANQTCMLFATDLNPRACHATKSTIHLNAIGAPFDMIRMNLLSAIHARHQFDVILMNPPYVVTESEDVSPGVLTSDNDKESCIAAAWAGGRDGREVVDQILGPLLASYLSPRGVMYLITVRTFLDTLKSGLAQSIASLD